MSDDEETPVQDEAPQTKQEGKKMEKRDKHPLVDQNGKVIESVKLRDYSKSLFFYPLFVWSAVAILIEGIWDGWGNTATMTANNGPHASIMIVWLILLFANVFVVSFDFSALKFLLLIFVIFALVATLVVLYNAGYLGVVSGSGTIGKVDNLKLGIG